MSIEEAYQRYAEAIGKPPLTEQERRVAIANYVMTNESGGLLTERVLYLSGPQSERIVRGHVLPDRLYKLLKSLRKR